MEKLLTLNSQKNPENKTKKLLKSSETQCSNLTKHLNLKNRLISDQKIDGEVQGNINWNNLMGNFKNVKEVSDQATFKILENEQRKEKLDIELIQKRMVKISERMRTEFLELTKINQNLETYEIPSAIHEIFHKFNEKIKH